MNVYIIVGVIFLIMMGIVWIMLKSGTNYYIIGLIVFIFLGLAAYVSSDTITEPTKKLDNQTGQILSVECGEGFTYLPDKGYCFNPSPFGHTIFTLADLMIGVFALAAIGQSTFMGWRMYKSPKIKFLVDKYQDENKDIPKNIDVYHGGDYIWCWGGYGRLWVSRTNDVFVAHNSMISNIGENLLFKGRRQEVTPKALMQYLGGNVILFKSIMGKNANPTTNKIKLTTEESDIKRIYIPLPLSEKEYNLFLSEKGNYNFGANRFKKVIIELFKMRKSISLLKQVKTGTMTSTLTTGVTLAEKTGVILGEVNKGKKENILRETSAQPYQDSGTRRENNGY